MARLFDGTNADFLQIDQSPVTAAPFYVSGWFRRDATVMNMTGFILVDASDEVNHRWQLRDDTGAPGLRWRARDGALGESAITSIGTTINVWQHYLGVEAAADDRRVYLDGGNKGVNTVSRTPLGIDRTTIGRAGLPGGGGTAWSGDLAHIAIYSGIPTDDDARTLSEGINPLAFKRDDLIEYWPIGGQSGEPGLVAGLTLVIFGTPTKSEEPPIPHSVVAPG